MLRRALGAALVVSAATAGAQSVPGRDLLHYPLGLAGEAAALGGGPASGFWNPATALLGIGERARLAASALSAPIDLALTGQVFHGALRRPPGTLSLSVARAAVGDLVHTETDPQSVGTEISYNTWLVSLGLARRVHEHVVIGAAVRWHTGHVYRARGTAFATDVGVVVDGVTRRDARIAMSSFLWTFDGRDQPTLTAAADARVAGPDTLRALRAGYSVVATRGAVTERYLFLDARGGKLSVRGGPVQMEAYGHRTWRLRLALVLRQARYTVGVVREDNGSGLAPTYQLGVANVFR